MPAYVVTVSHGPRVIGQTIWTDVDQSPLVSRGYLREVPKEVLDEYPGALDDVPRPGVDPDPATGSDLPEPVKKPRKARAKKVTEEVPDVEVGAELPGDPGDVES